MSEYRVNLDVYNGPLDLLLYLIRRDEVDVRDIPISRVTQQYVKYVDLLQQVDPNLAGEFLVMAAALMELKTRMLLPAAVDEEGAPADAGELGLDPRAELVRQLLQYKAFKDAAGELATAAQVQAMKFARRPVMPATEHAEFDMEDVQVWDLLDAFSKIMASIGQQGRQHEVIYDDTPVELHAEDIVDRLRREGPLTFHKVFEGRTNRGEIVGLFIALLELVRQKRVFAVQDDNFADIRVEMNPNPPAQESDLHVASFAGPDDGPPGGQALAAILDEPTAVEAGPEAPAAGPSQDEPAEEPLGQYVSEARPQDNVGHADDGESDGVIDIDDPSDDQESDDGERGTEDSGSRA